MMVEELQALNIKIVDFSPEWDYTEGGAKVIVCISPSLPEEYVQSAGEGA